MEVMVCVKGLCAGEGEAAGGHSTAVVNFEEG